MRPIGLDGQGVGPSGVATGRGALHLSSSSSVGDEENSTDGSFTLYIMPTGEVFSYYANGMVMQ